MIDIKNITYSYDKVNLFNGLNLQISDNESWGILGFNGAGKSTLLKLLLGIIRPASGNIEINKSNIYKFRKKIMQNTGVVWGQKPTLWWDVPVRDSYNMLKKIYKINDKLFRKNLDFFDEEFQISEFWDRPLRTLSLGQRIKAEIVGSLLHNPNILVYDEPFIGLDFLTRKKIVETLKKYKNRNNCILILTSHNMADIELLCDHILLINHGEILYKGSMKEIYQSYNTKSKISVTYQNEWFELSNDTIKKVEISQSRENTKQIVFDTRNLSYQSLIQEIINKNIILDITTDENLLEQVIETLVHNNTNVHEKRGIKNEQ